MLREGEGAAIVMSPWWQRAGGARGGALGQKRSGGAVVKAGGGGRGGSVALYVFWCSQVGAMAAALLHSAQCLGEEDDATSAKLPKRLALGSECTRQSNVKAKDDNKNARCAAHVAQSPSRRRARRWWCYRRQSRSGAREGALGGCCCRGAGRWRRMLITANNARCPHARRPTTRNPDKRLPTSDKVSRHYHQTQSAISAATGHDKTGTCSPMLEEMPSIDIRTHNVSYHAAL